MPEFWLDEDEWDIGYQHLRDGVNGPCLAIRTCINQLWESFHPFADKDFVSEFARQPDARFWEMYLTTSLLANGKNVRPRAERPKAGPDILVEESGTRIWIEAVTFGPGIDGNPDRVPPLKFDGNAHSSPNEQIELRISSVFGKKSMKILKYIKSDPSLNDDIQIVAINAGETALRCGYDGRGSPLTVLYPLGNQYVTFSQDSDRTNSGYERRDVLERSVASPVQIGMFANEEYAHISACVFSCTTLGNVHMGGRGAAIYHNCFAKSPISMNWHRWDVEWGCRSSEDGCEIFLSQ